MHTSYVTKVETPPNTKNCTMSMLIVPERVKAILLGRQELT
jgi:hypothetical protein